MTVAIETSKVQSTCTGGTQYTFTFKIFANADLTVIYTDTNGVETVLTLDTDYTVTGAGSDSGGTITTTSTYTSGTITMLYDADIKQETDLVSGGAFTADSIEASFDRSVKLIQKLEEQLSRAMLLKRSSGSSDLTMPDPVANKVLAINASADGLQLLDSAGSVTVPDIDFIGNYSDNLSTAISGIGANTKSLYLNKGFSLTGADTTPATLETVCLAETLITLGTNILTFNGPFRAPGIQVFNLNSTGYVKFGQGAVKYVDIRWFGAKTSNDAATNTPLIQAAINAAAWAGVPVYAPGGVWNHNTLYWYYDAVNNANHPSDPFWHRPKLKGEGMLTSAQINGGGPTYVSTVFVYGAATGNGMKFAQSGSASTNREGTGLSIEGVGFIANCNDYVLHFSNMIQFGKMDYVSVYNQHASGGGMQFEGYVYDLKFYRVFCLGKHTNFTVRPDQVSSKNGIDLCPASGDGSMLQFDLTYCSGWNMGFNLATAGVEVTFGKQCGAISNLIGLNVTQDFHVQNLDIESFHAELNVYNNIRVDPSAGTTGSPISLRNVHSSSVVGSWQASKSYSLNQVVINDTPARFYVCTTAGTSAAAGGPTGTGSGIADNTVVWDYIGAVDGSQQSKTNIYAASGVINFSAEKCRQTMATDVIGFLLEDNVNMVPRVEDCTFAIVAGTTGHTALDMTGSVAYGSGVFRGNKIDSGVTNDIVNAGALREYENRYGNLIESDYAVSVSGTAISLIGTRRRYLVTFGAATNLITLNNPGGGAFPDGAILELSFVDAGTVNDGTSMELNTGANIAVVAGDCMRFRYYATAGKWMHFK